VTDMATYVVLATMTDQGMLDDAQKLLEMITG
jgi:hypothetical protein